MDRLDLEGVNALANDGILALAGCIGDTDNGVSRRCAEALGVADGGAVCSHGDSNVMSRRDVVYRRIGIAKRSSTESKIYSMRITRCTRRSLEIPVSSSPIRVHDADRFAPTSYVPRIALF